jgi:hypothetical protein
MQVLPLLVQLSDLRPQSALDKHADLPAMCNEPALILLLGLAAKGPL